MNNFFQPFSNLINSLTKIIGGGIGGLLLAVGTIVFFASVIAFIAARAKGDSNGLQDAKNRLLLSVVGLFFMVAVWGIVRFLELNILGNQVRCVNPPQSNFGQNAKPSSGCSSSGSSSGSTYYGTSNSNVNGVIVPAQDVLCNPGTYCAYNENDSVIIYNGINNLNSPGFVGPAQ